MCEDAFSLTISFSFSRSFTRSFWMYFCLIKQCLYRYNAMVILTELLMDFGWLVMPIKHARAYAYIHSYNDKLVFSSIFLFFAELFSILTSSSVSTEMNFFPFQPIHDWHVSLKYKVWGIDFSFRLENHISHYEYDESCIYGSLLYSIV